MTHPAGAMKKLSRTQQRRRQDILDASTKIFARDGFEAARMIDIAQEAGVAKGTLYLYFDTKVDLLESVIQTVIIPTIQAAGDTAKSESNSSADIVAQQFRIIAQRMASSEMQTLLRHMISGGHAKHSKLIGFYFENVVQAAVKVIGETIQNGVKSGEFRKELAGIDPLVLVGAQIYITVWKLLFEDISPIDAEDLSNDLVELMLRGLMKP